MTQPILQRECCFLTAGPSSPHEANLSRKLHTISLTRLLAPWSPFAMAVTLSTCQGALMMTCTNSKWAGSISNQTTVPHIFPETASVWWQQHAASFPAFPSLLLFLCSRQLTVLEARCFPTAQGWDIRSRFDAGGQAGRLTASMHTMSLPHQRHSIVLASASKSLWPSGLTPMPIFSARSFAACIAVICSERFVFKWPNLSNRELPQR